MVTQCSGQLLSRVVEPNPASVQATGWHYISSCNALTQILSMSRQETSILNAHYDPKISANLSGGPPGVMPRLDVQM